MSPTRRSSLIDDGQPPHGPFHHLLSCVKNAFIFPDREDGAGHNGLHVGFGGDATHARRQSQIPISNNPDRPVILDDHDGATFSLSINFATDANESFG